MPEPPTSEPEPPEAGPVRALLGVLDGELVQRLLRARLPPFDENEDDDEACLVHLAAAKGDLPLLRACLAADPSLVHLEGCSGQQPLHYAARALQSQAVDELLAAGASAAACDSYGRTAATHMAFCYGGLSVVEQMAADAMLARLVAAGLDLNAQDEDGSCALREAAASENAPMVRLLMKHGASARLEGTAGGDLLCCAVHGIDCSNAAEGLGTLRRLLEGGAPAAARSKSGSTPLLAAAQVVPSLQPKHATMLLQQLLRHGADARATDAKGRNCFHHLAAALPHPHCNHGALAAALEVLLPVAGGAAALSLPDERGYPPLAFAVLAEQYETVQLAGLPRCPDATACLRLLINSGANPLTPFSLVQWGQARTVVGHILCIALDSTAMMQSALATLGILMDAGVDINGLDLSGHCALTYLLRYAASIEDGMDVQQEELFWQVLDTMREWGACPNATRRALASPLEHRRADVVALCPIRHALRHGDLKLLRWLVAAGADVLAANGDGEGELGLQADPLLRLVWDDLMEEARWSMKCQCGEANGGDKYGGKVEQARAHVQKALALFAELRQAGVPLLGLQTLPDTRAREYWGRYGSWEHSGTYQTLRMVRQLFQGWQWERERHGEAPQAFREAAHTLLLINRCRGFPIATLTAGSSKRPASSRSTEAALAEAGAPEAATEVVMTPAPQRQRQRQRQQRVLLVQERRVSLEPELVLEILRLAGADVEPWVRAEVASRRMTGWDVPRHWRFGMYY